MKRLAGLVFAAAVCVSGVCFGQIIPRPSKAAFMYQGRLHFKGDPADGAYDFDFCLYDGAEGGLALKTVSLSNVNVDRGYFHAALDFGSAVFDGSDLWLEIRVKPFKGIGLKTTLTPRQPIKPVPYATHAAQAKRAETAEAAESLSGTVDVSQITGLLGQGASLQFPDLLYNRAGLEIEGIVGTDGAVIVSPLGYQIDRIVTYDPQGNIIDRPGFSMEYPLVLELAPGAGCDSVIAYFDDYWGDPQDTFIKAMSVIVNDITGDEQFRYNFFYFAPRDYEEGLDGRTRFTFVLNRAPDNLMHWNFAGPDFGNMQAYNPETDSGVEIEGVGAYDAEVQVNAAERTVTLTFAYNEGAGIYNWVRQTIERGLAGASEGPAMSIIQWDANHDEVSRRNYFRCFPVRYEILDGFGLDIKLRHRVVITYSVAFDA